MDLLLGVDDTDVAGQQPGTGRLARELGQHLERKGMAEMLGVLRHQLLVDPRIPYTSHNSPACLLLKVDANEGDSLQEVFDVAGGYISIRSAPGSDPGLCLGVRSQVQAPVIEFGWRASSLVLAKHEALELAAAQRLLLAELGGTGDGVIGALAAVGLTAEGNAGRFLELAGGLRDFVEEVPARALRQRGMTLLCTSRNAEWIPDDAMVHTDSWVRPRLIAGKPVLLVERTEQGWRCLDRKQRHEEGM